MGRGGLSGKRPPGGRTEALARRARGGAWPREGTRAPRGRSLSVSSWLKRGGAHPAAGAGRSVELRRGSGGFVSDLDEARGIELDSPAPGARRWVPTPGGAKQVTAELWCPQLFSSVCPRRTPSACVQDVVWSPKGRSPPVTPSDPLQREVEFLVNPDFPLIRVLLQTQNAARPACILSIEVCLSAKNKDESKQQKGGNNYLKTSFW